MDKRRAAEQTHGLPWRIGMNPDEEAALEGVNVLSVGEKAASSDEIS